MQNLAGKLALVTGAGHGLGQQLSRDLAAAGAHVIVTDRDFDRVTETLELIHNDGFAASGYAMDVTDINEIKLTRNRIHAEHGPIDVLVNNAGVVFGGGFLEVPMERHLATYEINTIGLVAVTHTFLPDLIKKSAAHLVNISSASALIPLAFGSTYASSKWAVLGFTRSIREELRTTDNRHIKITAVCPSYINTGMFDGVKAPFLCRQLTPQRISNLVMKAIHKDKETVLAPWLVKLIPLGKGMLPRFMFRALLRFLGVSTGMASWCGHETDEQKSQEKKPQRVLDWARKVASL